MIKKEYLKHLKKIYRAYDDRFFEVTPEGNLSARKLRQQYWPDKYMILSDGRTKGFKRFWATVGDWVSSLRSL